MMYGLNEEEREKEHQRLLRIEGVSGFALGRIARASSDPKAREVAAEALLKLWGSCFHGKRLPCPECPPKLTVAV